jgi:hypothetical protein
MNALAEAGLILLRSSGTVPGVQKKLSVDRHPDEGGRLVLPDDKDETALTLNGKKSQLRRGDWMTLSESRSDLPSFKRPMEDP